jgi:hypothetical protein
MIKEKTWPVKAMYILIAAALAISLFITMAPGQNQKVSANSNDVTTKWDKVSTPTLEGWVLAPESTIIDFAVASGGDVAYAVVYAYDETWNNQDYRLLKSDDGAATWTDLTDTLTTQLNDDGYNLTALLRVETDGTDPDFVAVALVVSGVVAYTPVHVYISTDGGDSFVDAGEVEGGGVYLPNYGVCDLAVSPEVSGKRDIAIGGTNGTAARIFRATVTGDTASAWKDGTHFDGWDDGVATASRAVTFMEFSPNYATDKTILITTVADGSTNSSEQAIYLQCGSWGTTSPGWNDHSTLGIDAVPIIDNVPMPTGLASIDIRGLAGLTLPSDYNSKNSDTRVLWVWVNYWDIATGNPLSVIMRVDNDSVDKVGRQVKTGTLWLTNVSYYGTIAEGKAIAGILGTGGIDYNGGYPYYPDLFTVCCEGVQVYRNTGINDMDICCQNWQKACKPPTGKTAMGVWYVSSDKAYAVALDGFDPYDEGAWSVSFDDGNTWNQLSLVDTYINYFSDTAVSPDCNKMWVVSVNVDEGCGCDSVWLRADTLPEAEEYSGYWIRVWSGELTGYWDEADDEGGFIRLPMTETTGDTVYLVDYGTSNVYVNDLEGLGCWTPIASTTLDEIVDLVATDVDMLYALDVNGDVSMYDSEGWHDAVSSGIDDAWTIAVHGDSILVGAMKGGYVAYSDDGGETFDLLEETPTIDGKVTVAFDTYFDTNSVIYVAVEDYVNGGGGVYRWVIGDSTEWKDLGANHDYAYTGLVLGFEGGNPFSNADTGGVLYASYVGDTCGSNWSRSDDFFNCWKTTKECWQTGVARCLTPAGEITCEKCVEWDYLTVGLEEKANFEAAPEALKMCGCLTADTNAELFAVDTRHDYNMIDGTYDVDVYYDDGRQFVDDVGGAVWTFEDCYAKKAPDLLAPASNVTIPADCNCNNLPFAIKWSGVCDACYYDVQIALDPEFTDVVPSLVDYTEGANDIGGATGLSYVVPGDLTCQVTYYWRVRAHEADTCQIIHSWWSDTGSFTIAPSVEQAAITLVAPVSGATDVGIKNVGFSWDLTAMANKFNWVLSPNADLSSPLDSKTGLTNKAYTYTGTLTHGTTYYWQVKAYQGSTLVSTSAVGVFTTGALGAYCDPVDGMCFDTLQELQAHQATHPAPATPFWVWVVIAIGAVLVIVVIVLIFRTRRV